MSDTLKETTPLVKNPSTLERGESTDEGTMKLAWRHFGDVVFQVSAVSAFVLLGAGQVLAARASVGPDGSLPYDSMAAVFWVEAIKFTVALLWLAFFDTGKLARPVPRSWYKLCVDLALVALLFTATNELNFVVIEQLGASLFAIASNLKIVFTCVFMRLMLGKVFSRLQWLGVAMLTFSAAVVKLPVLAGAASSLPSSLLLGGSLLLISTACSGLASVKNELILKNADPDGPEMSFMMKNGVLYLYGTLINLGSWAIMGKKGLTEGFNPAAITSVFLLVGLGLSCAVILCYLDNVARCFGSVAQVLVTVAASQVFFATSSDASDFGFCYVVALVLLAVALVIYQSHQSPNLLSFVALAAAVSGTVGFACTQFRT